MAENDHLVKEKTWYGAVVENYKTDIYMRCQVIEGIPDDFWGYCGSGRQQFLIIWIGFLQPRISQVIAGGTGQKTVSNYDDVREDS